jgi:hypothetical protein
MAVLHECCTLRSLAVTVEAGSRLAGPILFPGNFYWTGNFPYKRNDPGWLGHATILAKIIVDTACVKQK